MKLIKVENYELKIADEALLVKPIRRLWNMDRSQSKETFYKQMSVLFFVYSPASNYAYINDEDERLKEVLAQEGITDFKMTQEMKNAIEVYRKLCETPETLLLEDMYAFVDKTRKALRTIDYEEVDDLKEKVNTMKNGMSMAALVPKLVQDLTKARRAVEKEQEEEGKTRGAQELSVGDMWMEQGI